ncbi:MAG: type II toxin-antitoxin system VapC family toxin [Acidimicrobiales bacterium]
MGPVVVDASVVIAFRDSEDAHHRAADRVLTNARKRGAHLVLPASAFAESLVHPLAAGVSEERATQALTRVFTVEPLTSEIAVAAARLRATTKLRLPDALVVATGMSLDADQILTCDQGWRGTDRRVRTVGAT